MAQLQTGPNSELVLQGSVSGLTVIPQPTVLTRLNYFDGKFLRASDMQSDQEYLRMLVEVSNLGGGAGVVNGFDTVLGGGDQINLGPGLAIDGAGRVLMLPTGTSFGAQALIDASRRVTPVVIAGTAGSATFVECSPTAVSQPGAVASGQDIYLLTIGHAEALCGEEDVYGRLCEAACATSTDRPYRVEGVVVRAVPFTPTTPLPTSTSVALSGTHLRSQLASAYFADEVLLVASLISKSGLALDTWCLGARLGAGQDVPLAVFARSGQTTLFLDAWTARRERIETPARRYWAWRMMMRPWDVYLAQILQFQCQLHDLILAAPASGGPPDPCKTDAQLLGNAAQLLHDISVKYTAMVASLPQATALPQAVGTLLPGGITRLETIRADLAASLQGLLSRPTNRVLINGGIIELPSAGYLPVDIGSVTVNDQVRKLLGEGLDLRFCVVRPDYVAHALEEAEHMERISLLTGLDHPEAKPKVDILVPNGQIVEPGGAGAGTAIQGEMQLAPSAATFTPLIDATSIGTAAAVVDGAGHVGAAGEGGWAFAYAATSEAPAALNVGNFVLGLNAFLAADAAGFNTFTGLAQTRLALHANVLSSPTLIPRVTTMAAAASDSLIAFHAAAAAPTETAAPAPAPFAPTVAANERRVIAVWISFQIDRNPFTMSPGDQTSVSSRITFVSPAATPAFVDQRTQGQLTIKQVVPGSGGDMQLIGHLSGFSNRAATGQAQPVTSTVEQDWGISLTHPAGQGPQLEIVNMIRLGSRTELKATWSGAPRTVQATLTFAPEAGQPTTVAGATMTVDPDVLVPANPTHLQALAALRLVGAGIQDPAFPPAAERQLFPPPVQATAEQIVQPTLDWVLFQRRREAICAAAVAVAAPLKTYQLYGALVQDPKLVAPLRTALMQNDWPTITKLGVRFTSVDQVQFGGGVSALVTPSATVLTDWKATGTGNRLDYAAMADRGVTDPFLAQARLGALEQAIVSVTSPDPALINETIPNIPVTLDIPGTDGIIVLVTHQLTQTICHTVYRVNSGLTSRIALENAAKNHTIAPLLQPGIATKVADVQFTAGTSTIVPGGNLVGSWNKVGGAAPVDAMIISSAGGAGIGDPTLRESQTKAVLAALNGIATPTLSDLQVTDALPADNCPVIDFVVPALRFEVYAASNASTVFKAMEEKSIASGTFSATDLLTLQGQKDPVAIAELGQAEFWGGTNVVRQPANKLASLKWRNTQVLRIEILFYDTPEGATLAEAEKVIGEQVASITGAIGGNKVQPAFRLQKQVPPGGSPILVFFVVERA